MQSTGACREAALSLPGRPLDPDVTARTLPADTPAWERPIAQACREAATRHLGRATNGRRSRIGWLPIVPESWQAGRRRTGCSEGIYGSDGNPEPVSGPIAEHTG